MIVLPTLALLVTARALAFAHAAQAWTVSAQTLAIQDEEKQREYQRRKLAAGEDVAALWDLYLWCEASAMTKEAKACLRAIVRADPDHREAHERLGHFFYDGKWFTSEKQLESYRKEHEKRIAEEKALVRYADTWVPADDVPFLERGLVRADDGQWVTAEEYAKLASGWVRQDLEWVSPEEKHSIEDGLWKCGDQWLEIAAANRYHAELDRWWRIPGERFLLLTTCDREVANQAMTEMNTAYRDLQRIFGKTPGALVPVVVLRDKQQYNTFAAGVDGVRPPSEIRGLSSIHYGYFADAWFDPANRRFMAAGVALWDSSINEGKWGRHAVRHAAAHAFVEALDASPKTVARGEAAGGFTEKDGGDFWSEKQLPEWFRWGASAYVERYFIDNLVEADGNPTWAREWSVQSLVSRGGLPPFSQLFEGRLSVDDAEKSGILLNARGLIVYFVLDGGCKPVIEAHDTVKETILAGKDPGRAVDKLAKAIEEHEKELRAFAGL